MRRPDPLALFMAAGLALYLLLDALGLARGDERLIVVDEARLAAFMAGQGGQAPTRQFAGLSPAERGELVDAYVREEALYREAKALGLDRDDAAIRRRLVQSLRFSLQAAGEAPGAMPSDAQLRAYLAAHRDRYEAADQISFSHIFFDTRRRGRAQAGLAARQGLAQAGKGDWLAQGDRYPYQRGQIDVTEATLAAELGNDAARRIFALPADGRWRGPVESALGFHLVRVDRKSPGGLPAFDTLRPELAAAIDRERRERGLGQAIDAIVSEYSVRIAPGLEAGPR